MQQHLLSQLTTLEARYKRTQALYLATLAILVDTIFGFAFTGQDRFDIIRAKGIIIEYHPTKTA